MVQLEVVNAPSSLRTVLKHDSAAAVPVPDVAAAAISIAKSPTTLIMRDIAQCSSFGCCVIDRDA
jgi:hypothetical protein